MITDLRKAQYTYDGEAGLPLEYPKPDIGPNGLFYIQRNQNTNTIVYEVNRDCQGYIDGNDPLYVYWIRYVDEGQRRELNVIQKQLAYGYRHERINHHSFEIHVVSYPNRKIYIDDATPHGLKASMIINGKMAYISNIYVYALEMGLFPDVKYLELYGLDHVDLCPVYEKIEL